MVLRQSFVRRVCVFMSDATLFVLRIVRIFRLSTMPVIWEILRSTRMLIRRQPRFVMESSFQMFWQKPNSCIVLKSMTTVTRWLRIFTLAGPKWKTPNHRVQLTENPRE